MHLAAFVIGDAPAAWESAGFVVDATSGPGLGNVDVGGVRLRLSGAEGVDGGIQRWELADPGNSGPGEIDGLPTAWRRAGDVAPRALHPNGALLFDHLVVASPDIDRTTAAFATNLGVEPRRRTEFEVDGRRMTQTFFLLRPTVLEVISPLTAAGDGPSSFWGFAFTVEDLDATKDLLGSVLSDPQDAVQPGRRIATLRTKDLGISVPIAFLTPRPPRP